MYSGKNILVFRRVQIVPSKVRSVVPAAPLSQARLAVHPPSVVLADRIMGGKRREGQGRCSSSVRFLTIPQTGAPFTEKPCSIMSDGATG
jgi:hypothetical protein